jgi:hypothetical protein
MLRSRVKNGAELTEPPNTGGIGELTAVDGRLRWTGHVPTRGHGRAHALAPSQHLFILRVLIAAWNSSLEPRVVERNLRSARRK